MRKYIFSILFLAFVFSSSPAFAQETQQAAGQGIQLEARVEKIIEEKEIFLQEKKQQHQKLDLVVTNGSLQGKHVTVENGEIPVANPIRYKAGDAVVVSEISNIDGTTGYYISDYVRRIPLYVLFSIFIILTVFVAGLRGMMSLIGMLFSFGVILKFILPQISAGHDPVAVAIGASFLIIPVTFYLSHGISGKTTVAVVGTILSLIVTGILASVFIAASKLTGFSSEEAGFLAALRPDMVSIQGLLLAGIIIGTLGILDDITISQSSIVEEIKRTDPNLNWRQVYSKAMRVGKDHISSLVNTLVLVYTGAALPLLLLFVNNPRPFSEIINYEMIAEEIVRTLVASIGLILAVPLTTFVACFFARKK